MILLIRLLDGAFQLYSLMLFATILASWLPQLHSYSLMQWIRYYTDPYLRFFRNIIPPLGMIDISPIVAFLCLSFIQDIVIKFVINVVINLLVIT